MSTSIPRSAGLPGGPNRQGWAAVSGPAYAGPSSSHTKSAGQDHVVRQAGPVEPAVVAAAEERLPREADVRADARRR
ncbi:MAG TPA: hypothetical protein VG142_12720 [Trebonia sp.]|nr:hypothetical protein [Trebonia sp.]